MSQIRGTPAGFGPWRRAGGKASATPVPASTRQTVAQGRTFTRSKDDGSPTARTTNSRSSAWNSGVSQEALVHAAQVDGEAGIFVAFEENSRQIIRNAASFGWDLPSLQREGHCRGRLGR